MRFGMMLDKFGLMRRWLIARDLYRIYISLENLVTHLPEIIRTLGPEFSNADANGVSPV
jgi:hypothetical protein